MDGTELVEAVRTSKATELERLGKEKALVAATDAVAEVGGKGHYFGIGHTQARYETAFYRPFLSDLRSHEAWRQDGGVWTAERAHRLFRAIVARPKGARPSTTDASLLQIDGVVRRHGVAGCERFEPFLKTYP